MKRIFLVVFLYLISFNSFGQQHDISISVGTYVPMYKGVQSDAVTTLSYGQFYKNNIGFRAGLKWNPYILNINNAFGVPVAFVYKTNTKSSKDRFNSGIISATESAKYPYSNSANQINNFFAAFLINLFSDIEFFAGLTPGYTAGSASTISESSWGESFKYWRRTWFEKNNAFSITADAGFNLNYRIWHFNLKLSPSLHYNILNTYVQHTTYGEVGIPEETNESKSIKWFFSFSGGLSWLF